MPEIVPSLLFTSSVITNPSVKVNVSPKGLPAVEPITLIDSW